MLKEEILIDSCQDKTSRYVGYHSWYIERDKILKKNGTRFRVPFFYIMKNELHEEVITDRFMLVDVADRVGKHGSDR